MLGPLGSRTDHITNMRQAVTWSALRLTGRLSKALAVSDSGLASAILYRRVAAATGAVYLYR